jgi:transposase
MTQNTVNEMTIGIDLGDQYSHFCALDRAGEILEEGRLKTTKEAFIGRFKDAARMRIAIEASTHSPWVSALLDEAGHEVIVANPRKLRMIFKSDSKNDRFDAGQLARVARLDPKLLYPIEHRRQQARVDQGLIKARDGLVRARTQLVNHVRSTIKSFGMRLSVRGTSTFGRRAARQIPKELRPALVPILRMIEHHSASIARYDRLIEEMGRKKYPETMALRQVAGVGPITALSFVLTLDDPLRFKNSRAVGAFLGLRPKQDQSGERNPELRITKAGNRELRRLLVQGAQYILGPFGKDTDLRRFGESIAARGGKVAKRRALVAVLQATDTCPQNLTQGNPPELISGAIG